MLIALLAVLGVNLVVVAVLLVGVLSRRRWVSRQPGAFRGAIRVSGGELDGVRSRWGRGYGRWVRHVLVWTHGPFFFRNELVAVDDFDEQRPARAGELKRKRLGDDPVVMQLKTGTATVEVAARDDASEHLLGPYATPAAD